MQNMFEILELYQLTLGHCRSHYSHTNFVLIPPWPTVISHLNSHPVHILLNFYGLIADHKVAGWQPIRIQHLRSLLLIAQSAVEKTATLWSVINPEQFSNSWLR